MQIRRATEEDLNQLTDIYAIARRYMAEHGNATQWGSTRPTREDVLEDIRAGACHVGVDEADVPRFVFALFDTPEPCYREICDGAWLNDEPYLAMHRVASDGAAHGVVASCVTFARARAAERGVRNIRIDTHENNHTMQAALARAGFVHVGTIFLADGSPRLAYQLVLE